MHRIILLTLLSILIFLPDSFAENTSRVFNTQTLTLKNGMRAILIENHRAPVTTHMVWYGVGAADEPLGQSGIAHYLEHLMFKGTKKLASGEFSKTVKRLGGQENAFTSQDYTGYYQTVSARNLEKVMRMEADRMLNLTIPETEAIAELDVVLEERRQRLENNPQAQFFTNIYHSLYIGHPYATPIIGWRDDIKNLNTDKANAFYKNWYQPANATLIIAGDISFKKFKKLAQKIYGKLPKTPKTQRRDFSQIAPLNANHTVNMSHHLVRQPIYARIFRAPSWTQNSKDSFTLQVLEEYLSGSESSPLYQELVVKQKLASRISLSYDSFAKGPGSISISAYPNAGVTSSQIIDAVTILLEKISQTPPSKQEIAQVKTRLKDSAIFTRDSISEPAFLIGRAVSSDIPLQEIETWPNLIENVSVEDVSYALNTYILNDNVHYVEGTLTPGRTPPTTQKEISGDKS